MSLFKSAATAVSGEAIPLAVDNLTVTFGGLTAVSEMSLKVRAGECVGLIGPNGAGKTTLVNAIAGEIRPATGSVQLGRSDASRLKPFQRFRAGLARTFQVAHPFPELGVLDAVMLGPLAKGMSRPDAQAAAHNALATIGRGHQAGRIMRELNPTESKLVELARVIASEPTVVLLDELLAGSLPRERQMIIEKLAEASAQGQWATIMIEHLIPEVRSFCERVVVMDQGRLIADGPTDQVMHDPQVLAAYLGKAMERASVVAQVVAGDE
jgi:branched-chain amino acid transport system ATP-binding protein